jgi:hypothetical protein
MKSFNDLVLTKRALSPVSVSDNTAQVSEIIDTQGFHGLEFLIITGSIADADATFAVTLHEGDVSNLSDAAAVATTNLDGTLAAAGFQFDDDNETRRIGVIELTKRYYRLTITPTNNASAALLGAVALLHSPRKAPTGASA